METLKEIIKMLIILSISIASITFIIFMVKIVIEPEEKRKYIRQTKNLIIAVVLITVSLSLTQIPTYYYGSVIEIVSNETSETTIGELKDIDVQGRETVNIDGKWYVVTDTNKTIGALTANDTLDNISSVGVYDTGKVIENISFLRLFSESQGTFKGYFAEIKYYRDSDGLIFPREYTYNEYQELKAENN